MGRYLKARCFYGTHKDDDPSLVIYPNDTCFCHGCHVWGNLNTIRRFFGDAVIINPRERKNNTKEALMELYKEKKTDPYLFILRVRGMRKWYKDIQTLNKRLMIIIGRYYENAFDGRYPFEIKAGQKV